MVIGVEGNVHVGKTTFINEYNFEKNYKIIKEVKFIDNCNDYDRQLYYIDCEISKKLKNGFKNLILDRTILSTYIYCLYSKKFNSFQIDKLENKICDCINLDIVIIPDILLFVMMPYAVICENHRKLFKIKGTQQNLIDYNYYLMYNLFFSNNLCFFNKIYKTNGWQQIIEFFGDKIFKSISSKIKDYNSKILLDGPPAIGKSSIGMKQSKYNYISEFSYKTYSLDHYDNQLDSIIERINILKTDNIIADTSFLMGITHLFYNQKTEKNFKLKIIRKIIDRVPLCLYTTKIIYLIADKDVLYFRKHNDLHKKRNHFADNMKYLKYERNFFEILNKNLGFMSNIKIIDANKSIDELIDDIYMIDDKPLLLIDLLYCIKNSIEGDEL